MADHGDTPSNEELTLEAATTVRKPRPRALWAALAVVALAAGALAVTSGGDDGTAPPLPVALGALGARNEAGAMAADMSLAWVTYVAGPGLPDLGGEAAAYRLDGTVDRARVIALAGTLGFESPDELLDQGSVGGTWRLESDHGTLEVFDQGGGSWWFSAQAVRSGGSTGSGSTSSGSAGCEPGPAVDCGFAEGDGGAPATTRPTTECVEAGADCATAATAIAECPPDAPCAMPPSGPCAPDAGCPQPPTEDCPEGTVCPAPYPDAPTPPADLPTRDEARAIALDLIAATGMDVRDATVTVEGPYDVWYVMVEPKLDGTAVSGWGASVGVGSQGAITNASGTLGSPERLGDYPLVDTRAAIDRLNALQSGAVSMDGGGVSPMRAVDDGAASSGTGQASPAEAPTCPPDDGGSTGSSCVSVPTTSTVPPPACKPQPDGSEICEPDPAIDPPPCVTILPAPATPPEDTAVAGCADPGVCDDAAKPTGTQGTDTTIADIACGEPLPVPVPQPLPQPLEVVLTAAERVLTLMPALDGGGDAYLVPGYRFSNDDGAVAEVAAVADDSLAPTTTTTVVEPTTTVPSICDPAAGAGAGPSPDEDAEPCPAPIEPSQPDLVHLSEGEEPQVGVRYYVDVNTHCGWFVLGSRWWATGAQTPLPWSAPTEGGAFTLTSPDAGTFVGDAAGTKTEQFTAQGPAEDLPACA